MLISTNSGICSQVLRRPGLYYTFEQTLREIAQAGFPAVDFGFVTQGRAGMPMDLANPNWRDWVRQQKELADSLGLVTCLGHAHYYSRDDSYRFTPEEREHAQAMIRRDIEAAGMCSIPWLVVHPDSYREEGNYSHRKSLAMERERFLRFGELAAKWNVGLAIENMVDNSGIRRFAGSHEDLLELMELLGDRERFGICWDTGHANLGGIDQGSAIRAMGGWLRALHINDNLGTRDDHLLPFLGTVDWQSVMQALHDIGYQGDFNYEIHGFTKGCTPENHPLAVKYALETAQYMIQMAK